MAPVCAAVLNDCQLVVDGVAAMLSPYQDRVQVAQLACRANVTVNVDIGLYDAFAVETSPSRLRPHLENPYIGRLVVYTWLFDPASVEAMMRLGVRGVVAKSLPADELVAAVERVHAGDIVVLPAPGPTDTADLEEHTNPLVDHALTVREAEVVALIANGLSNEEIARQLYISINTVKSCIRSAYRRIGVTRRSQAVAWAIERGLHVTTSLTTLPTPLGSDPGAKTLRAC